MKLLGEKSKYQKRPLLVRARVKRPKLSAHGNRIGGEDRAWVHREAMRDAWLDTPGAMAWLKKIMKIKGLRV